MNHGHKNTQPTNHQPAWWTKEHDTGWERFKDAMQRDWDQTRHDLGAKNVRDLDQDVDDTVRQAAGTQEIPPRGVPNAEPQTKEALNVAHDRDRYTEALRYGYGAASADPYRAHKSWDDKLESKMKQEWQDLKSGRTWDEVKSAVRSSFEKARRAHH